MITLAVTGHRPERLGNTDALEASFRNFIADNEVYRIYQGMCEGFDLLAAEVACDMAIPYVACRPWATHSSGSPNKYSDFLRKAQEVHVVNHSLQFPGPHAYHDRNHYMVDRADVVYAAWDGHHRGGTFQTIRYAGSKGKLVYRFNVDFPDESKWLG